MARLNLFPFIALAAIGGLALFGQAKGVYRNVDDESVCAYAVADLESPAANILFVGASRVGRGLDPVYIEKRLRDRTERDITVERVVLNTPNIAQFRPLLARYIAKRGAPDHVVFPLLYNFKPERQQGWGLPVNNLRNVTFGTLGHLYEIQRDAELNDNDGALPAWFQAGYMSFPALILQKLEINVYAALRWPILQGTQSKLCAGRRKFTQGLRRVYDSVDDALVFEDSDDAQARRARNLSKAEKFLPLAPNASWRRFETGQLLALIAELEAAGSQVILIAMPALGDTEITQEEISEIKATFPDNRFIHPYSLFETDLGPDLAKSFYDTHHATTYGALVYSRFFADALAEEEF